MSNPDLSTATAPSGPARKEAALGPAAPSPIARRLRPVSDVTIREGLWHELQLVNRSVTLQEAFRQLEEAGNLHNFRVAAGEEQGDYRGKLYLDSDVYKTLEAVAWEIGREDSAELRAWQTQVTDLIGRAQRQDGYLNTFVQVSRGEQYRYADLAHGHELFCGGHLIQAGIAQARATGQPELLEVSCRYADHLVATFGPGLLESTDGHPEIEMALVELYRETDTRAYLELAQFLVEVRGHGVLKNEGFGSAYFQDEQPVRTSFHVRGHAVRQVFLSAGVTDLYLETGDEELLRASVAQWEDMVAGKTYLTGGIGARWEGEAFGNAFELPPDLAYAETCAAHGSILWSWRLLLATGEARYADLIERTLYNGFASGLSLDGSRFFYVNALQNRPGTAGDSSRSVQHGRQAWYGTACCPPNVMRTLGSLHHYLATHDAGGVQVHQYMTGQIEADIDQGGVVLGTSSGLPWDGDITVKIEQSPAQEWTLALRIPSWAEGATAHVNADTLTEGVRPGTYLQIRRSWAEGDVVRLTLPVEPRLTRPDPRIDAVAGSVAVERGPLVYAFEQLDQPSGTDLDLLALLPEVPLQDRCRSDLLGGVVTVAATARPLRPAQRMGELPYEPLTNGGPDPVPTAEVVELTAVPYFRWANRQLGQMRVFLPTRALDPVAAATTATMSTAEENR